MSILALLLGSGFGAAGGRASPRPISRRVLTSRVRTPHHLVVGQVAAGLLGRQLIGAEMTIRNASRRISSWARMACVRSFLEPLGRESPVGRSLGGASPVGPPAARGVCGSDRCQSEPGLLGAGSLLALRFLALALDAGLLVVLASASLGENAALLDLLVEASQGTLEGLVFAYADFSQSEFTSHRRVCVPVNASARVPAFRAQAPLGSRHVAGRAKGAGSVAGKSERPSYECMSVPSLCVRAGGVARPDSRIWCGTEGKFARGPPD